MALELTKFDIQDYIKTPKDQAAYLDAVLADGDLNLLAVALGDIARARGAAAFARDSGIQRQTIYEQFRIGGNPRLSTVNKALNSLGMRISVQPK